MDCVLTIIVQTMKRENIQKHQMTIQKGERLQQVLLEAGIFLNTSCGGKGSCGKCRVLVQKGKVRITKADFSFFCEEEIELGYRLGCKVILEEDCTIFVPKEEFTKEIKGIQNIFSSSELSDLELKRSSREYGYGIGIDFGTTTIAMELIDLSSQESIAKYLSLNSQRQFGADVISRIETSNAGEREQLKAVSKEDVITGIVALIKESNVPIEEIKKAIFSGNTVMVHLFMGYSTEGLGKYPFTPVTLSSIQTSIQIIEEEKNKKNEIPIFIIPAISPFVGGDITAGIQTLHMCEAKEKSMLIDLGTNGEIVLWDGETLYTTSTAAGPAFEGVGIFFGTGNVDGAINKVIIDEENNCQVQTIHAALPIGICGSGVLSIISQLRKKEIVDETGLMNEPFFSEGFPICKAQDHRQIILTQSDIRLVQMAKAAIRAGVESLLHVAGIEAGEIDRVYLAGGLGNLLSKNEIDTLKILPGVMVEKIQFVGNSSLKGSIDFLHNENQDLKWMKKTKEVELATEEKFMTFFFEAMNF